MEVWLILALAVLTSQLSDAVDPVDFRVILPPESFALHPNFDPLPVNFEATRYSCDRQSVVEFSKDDRVILRGRMDITAQFQSMEGDFMVSIELKSAMRTIGLLQTPETQAWITVTQVNPSVSATWIVANLIRYKKMTLLSASYNYGTERIAPMFGGHIQESYIDILRSTLYDSKIAFMRYYADFKLALLLECGATEARTGVFPPGSTNIPLYRRVSRREKLSPPALGSPPAYSEFPPTSLSSGGLRSYENLNTNLWKRFKHLENECRWYLPFPVVNRLKTNRSWRFVVVGAQVNKLEPRCVQLFGESDSQRMEDPLAEFCCSEHVKVEKVEALATELGNKISEMESSNMFGEKNVKSKSSSLQSLGGAFRNLLRKYKKEITLQWSSQDLVLLQNGIRLSEIFSPAKLLDKVMYEEYFTISEMKFVELLEQIARHSIEPLPGEKKKSAIKFISPELRAVILTTINYTNNIAIV